jgi:two-component system, cell cycle response regulator DivK
VGQKILVVEDNELNLKLFCDLLRAHAYQAEPVRDGREAVARARSFAPDLIVMDIQMPHISGLELIEQIKADAELKPIPIMAVTAYAAKGDEERIRDAGAEGYVSKPISVLRFVEAVRALLDAAAARAAEVVEEPEVEAEASETEEAAAPEDEAASEESEASPDRHPGEGRGPDGDGEAEEEGKPDPGLRRDDAEPEGETPPEESEEDEIPPDRLPREGGGPDDVGEGEEEGKLDPGLRRDDQ